MAAIRWCGLGAIVILVAFAFVTHAYWLLPNHDSAIYVVEALKLLRGGRYYDDILEVTPPLIVLIAAPSVLIGQVTGLDLWTAFTALVCVLIVASVGLAWPYLRWACDEKPVASGLLAIAYVAAASLVPGYDFSQREHLAIVLFLPALLWFASREAGRPSPPDWRCLVVLILAALGLLIKPFLLAVPAILVVTRAVTHRDWRKLFGIETIVVVPVGLLYTLLVYVCFPGWLATAALAAQVYFGFQQSWARVVLDFLPGAGVELALVLVVLLLTPAARHRRVFMRQLAIGALGFLAMAVLQRKGWSYHVLPTRSLSFFIAVMLGLELAYQRRTSGISGVMAPARFIALFFVIASSMWHFITFNASRQRFLATPFATTVRELAEGGSWLALSTDVAPAFPIALLTGGQWASRSPHQWLIPGIVKLNVGNERDRESARDLKHLATGFVAEDLARNRPVMVAIKTGNDQGIAGPFEFLPFFLEDERFARAWAPYHLVRSIAGWQFYTNRQ